MKIHRDSDEVAIPADFIKLTSDQIYEALCHANIAPDYDDPLIDPNIVSFREIYYENGSFTRWIYERGPRSCGGRWFVQDDMLHLEIEAGHSYFAIESGIYRRKVWRNKDSGQLLIMQRTYSNNFCIVPLNLKYLSELDRITEHQEKLQRTSKLWNQSARRTETPAPEIRAKPKPPFLQKEGA